MDVAVIVAKRCPARAMRSARTGSLSGTIAAVGPVRDAWPPSSRYPCSTGLIPGVKGAVGVMGEVAKPNASWLDADSVFRNDGRLLCGLSPSSGGAESDCGGGKERPSCETTRLKDGACALLVA